MNVELEPVTAILSSTWDESHAASYCIDGVTQTHSHVCISQNEHAPWFAIDFGTEVMIERVEIFNTFGHANGARTRNVEIRISDELPTSGDEMFSGGTLLGHFAGPGTSEQHIIIPGQ